jgi:hypothetical protein
MIKCKIPFIQKGGEKKMHDSLISSIKKASYSLNIVCDLGAPSHKIVCARYCVTAAWPNARHQFMGVPDVPFPETVDDMHIPCAVYMSRGFTHP